MHVYINILIQKCDNKTSGIECKSESEIEEFLSNNINNFEYYLETNFADHNNKTNPIYNTYSYNNIPIEYTKTFYYVFFQNWKMMQYETDNGIFINDVKTYNTFVFDTVSSVASISAMFSSPVTIGRAGCL